MTEFQILSLVLGLVTAVLIIGQLFVTIRTLKADHERRKKQATIEHVREIRPHWDKHRRWLDDNFGPDGVTETALDKLDENKEVRENVRTLLAMLEHLAVGVNTGVFDKDLLYRMSGTYMVRIYHQLRPYIKRVQKDNQYAYVEYEEMATLFEESKRVSPDPRGGIRYS